LAVGVEESNDGSEDWGRAGSSIDLLKLALVGDEVVVAEGRDIRETSVLLVEVSRGWEFDSGFEISVNGGSLVAGGGDVI